MAWIWAGVFILTLVIEFITWEVVSIWFTLGSLIAFILSLCGVDSITVQIVVFLTVSVVTTICARPICKKFLDSNKGKTNLDAVIGKTYTLLKDITEDSAGEIKINDVNWRVVSKNGVNIKAGAKVKIIEVDGNKFIVEKEKK